MYQRRLAVAVRVALCVALALIALHRLPSDTTAHVALDTIAIRAQILETETADNSANLTLQEIATGRLYTAFTNEQTFSPGDAVDVVGALRPFDGPRNPGAFSERDMARKRGLTAAIDKPRIVLRGHVDNGAICFWPARFRLWAKQTVTGIFPSAEAAILTGMLWGDHRDLDYEDTTAFSATGTSHLLVTAGLHLGFFAAMLRLLLRVATVERRWAAAITLVWVCCVCIVSNAHIPSVRAAIMIGTFLAAEMLGTKAASWRTLAYAFCLTICFDPAALLDASCYLSFSCVFAIIHIAESLTSFLVERSTPRFIAQAIAVTCAAQIGTWALIAAQFHQISCIAPITNIIAIPLAMVILCLAPLLLIASAMHCAMLSEIAVLPLHLMLVALLDAVRCCAHIPLASITIRAPATWTLVCYEGALGASCWIAGARSVTGLLSLTHALRYWVSAKHRGLMLRFAFSADGRNGAAVAILAGASACVYASTCFTSHELRITMLDVGQGDGIVIETPHGHTILIDTGGRLELHAARLKQSPAEVAAEHVLLPFLRYEGITHIDLLLLTHPHGDHAGGVAPVLRSLLVDAFLDSGQRYPGAAYQDALDEVARRHVPRLIAQRGQTITFDDGVALHILAPLRPLFSDGRNDINENSIVAMLSYDNFRMLFTGDAGTQAEARLLATGTDLHADILKVGHHGSAYASSDAFLRAIHPRVALISDGRHNLFHHPAASTLERLQSAGARVYRTDRCGAISVSLDAISTMAPCL